MKRSSDLLYAIELALVNQLTSEGELSEKEAELVTERVQVKNGITRRLTKRMSR